MCPECLVKFFTRKLALLSGLAKEKEEERTDPLVIERMPDQQHKDHSNCNQSPCGATWISFLAS